MNTRRQFSLAARSLLAASLVLAAFIGLTGYALERAFEEWAFSVLRERLQSVAYSFLARTDVTVRGELLIPEFLPEPRLERPSSDLVASIYAENFRWESPSALDRELPFEDALKPGEIAFREPRGMRGGFYMLSMGVLFEKRSPSGKDVRVTINVGERQSSVRRQIRAFRETMWVALGGLGLLLLLFQALLLVWSLRPLRAVARDLARVERGEVEELPGHHPIELAALTRGLNDFIKSEREHLRRYRHTLGDLAHSLKTPLAVMRGLFENESDAARMRAGGLEQVQRMDEIVAYQLARAAKSGHQTYAAPLPILAHAEEIALTLEKVYAHKGALAEFEVDARSMFHGDKGDLMELMGNLLDNAFKWCRRRVLLTSEPISDARTRRPGLLLRVEDDGPGIPDDKIGEVLKRGVRGDERVQGHGIGLSIIGDIVASYGGEMKIGRSKVLGGAQFEVRLPPLGG
ncbi:MAG: HAMP domain-containing protein [Xanthomonadales bacterium PRO6]|nr:Adaptive-response sensory-kinase SasA [Xanthomonadales bacterium]MCE7929999.1 HAMP domain-containing protein [Xanthomonadales bacterium PRO6]